MQIHVFVKAEHQQSGCSFLVALRPVTRFRSSLASLAGPNEGISHPPGMKFHPESVMAFSVNCHSGGNRVTPPRNTCRLSLPLPGSKHVGIMTLIDKRLVGRAPIACWIIALIFLCIMSNHVTAPCATVASARLQLVHRCRQQPPGHLPTMDFEFHFVRISN